MKRGFTLVELLANIVILAIVSLITIPIITGVINKTRLNSFGRKTLSVTGVYSVIKTIAKKMLGK